MGSVKLAFKSVANKVSFSRFAGLDRMNASKSTGLVKTSLKLRLKPRPRVFTPIGIIPLTILIIEF